MVVLWLLNSHQHSINTRQNLTNREQYKNYTNYTSSLTETYLRELYSVCPTINNGEFLNLFIFQQGKDVSRIYKSITNHNLLSIYLIIV